MLVALSLICKLQRINVDGKSSGYKNIILGVHIILYTRDMWLGLANMAVFSGDNNTLLAHIPSPNVRSNVTKFLIRDLRKISAWCTL